MKNKINKKVLIIAVIIVVLLLAYYIYYRNTNMIGIAKWDGKLEDFIDEEDLKDNEGDVAENLCGEERIHQSDSKQADEVYLQETEKIIVHITGEVKSWGVIDLEAGSRVIDAVNKAGGFTDDADTERVNLAYVLTDGIKIYIPSKNETQDDGSNFIPYITSESGNNVIAEENAVNKKASLLVNINRATQTELETLPGIGPSIALKIILYREKNGDFSTIEDVKNVSGIGDNKFENIKGLICV